MYLPASRRLAIGVGLLVAWVSALSACSAPSQQQGAQARPLPEEGQDLRPGVYRSEEFEPDLSFRVGEGWTMDLEMSDVLAIRQGADVKGERALLGVANVARVFEPGTLGVTEAPDDLAGWFEHHPYLRTTEPEPVTVGGAEGVRVDVVVEDLPEDYYGVCGSGCVDLFELGGGHRHVVFESEKQRLIFLEDVKGEPVTIVFASAVREFDEVAPEAQGVIDTVKWEGA